MRWNEKYDSTSSTMGRRTLENNSSSSSSMALQHQQEGVVTTDDGFLVCIQQEDYSNMEPDVVFGGSSNPFGNGSHNNTTSTPTTRRSLFVAEEPERAFSTRIVNPRPSFFDGVDRSSGGGGGLARMKYDSYTGRNSPRNTLGNTTTNSGDTTGITTSTTTTTTFERRRRAPSPSVIPNMSHDRPNSLRNIKQQDSYLRSNKMMTNSSISSGAYDDAVVVFNKRYPRPSDSKQQQQHPSFRDFSSSSSRLPGAVAVSHHHLEDVTANTTSSGSNSNSNDDDDDCNSDEAIRMDNVDHDDVGRRCGHQQQQHYRSNTVQELLHIRPGVVNAIQKQDENVVELVFPHNNTTTIQATLVDPDWERERIREEIEQQAPRALVVSDNDNDDGRHGYKEMRCAFCIAAVCLLALSGLAVGLVFGLNLVNSGGGDDMSLSVQNKNVNNTDTYPDSTSNTSTTTTATDESSSSPFKDLGDECQTSLPVIELPFSYAGNTSLIEANGLACPTTLKYIYSQWFHVNMPTIITTMTISDNNTEVSSSSSSSLYSCITATTEGMDGVSMNVFQGTCNTLSCIMATVAPTAAQTEAPTSAPSPPPVIIWDDEQPDEENQIYNGTTTTTAPKPPPPTLAPVEKPPPFVVSKTTRSQVSWPHYDVHGNYTLLVSWPASAAGSFQLNITASECSSEKQS